MRQYPQHWDTWKFSRQPFLFIAKTKLHWLISVCPTVARSAEAERANNKFVLASAEVAVMKLIWFPVILPYFSFVAANFENTGGATVNGDIFQESNGPTDAYAAIARADRLTQEPESIRKWREEQKKRLQELDAASKVLEQEWREKAKKDLEEWNIRQNEQMERNQANNRASEEAFLKESKEETAGTEWEKVAQLCDFNPKSSKQSKDVSRMRSVLISLKQIPLAR
ncbi:clathrin light chain B [Python bivittatus]|uniref:Clathrin light chain n=1 Tax=Python bivittatus TaxID=176946 RepID=A0A9F5MYY0_PYTBI|nr:clathrin light chain B [Python bivittatus]